MFSKTLIITQANLAIQILNQLIKDKLSSSIVYSPICLAIALSMAYAGSYGLTKENIKKYLYGDCDDDEIHNHFKKFLISLSKENVNSLQSANKVYIEKSINLLKDFTQTIEEYYKGCIEKIDFTTSNAAGIINDFVSKSTNNTIKNVITPNDLPIDTKLLLINAIYFKNEWMKEFDKNFTEKEFFYTSKDVSKKVDLMYTIDKFYYYENNDYQVLQLLYKERYLLLKKIPLLDGERLFEMIELLNLEIVNVHLPKFKIESIHMLHKTFKKIGLTFPFSSDANFSLITNEVPLTINKIIQKAFIDVDEKGTEASGVSAITVVEGPARGYKKPREYIFRADHPFMYLIIDDKNNILFNGIYQ
uniref:SERPIN domain-containing protein n=1 Tax=Strongyloides stercoralis TaxID=6248 RepID=A0A0K0EJE6_STRER